MFLIFFYISMIISRFYNTFKCSLGSRLGLDVGVYDLWIHLFFPQESDEKLCGGLLSSITNAPRGRNIILIIMLPTFWNSPPVLF